MHTYICCPLGTDNSAWGKVNCRGWKEAIKPFPNHSLNPGFGFPKCASKALLISLSCARITFTCLRLPSWGKMNTSLPGWCERPEDKWLILCLMPSMPKRSILLYCLVPPIHHGIRDLQWGKNLDSHLARATCIWTSAQPFTSNLRWCVCVCVCTLVAQSHLTLCNLMDCSPPGSSVHGILQARILEWVVIPFSRGSSQPRDRTRVSCIAGGFFTT